MVSWDSCGRADGLRQLPRLRSCQVNADLKILVSIVVDANRLRAGKTVHVRDPRNDDVSSAGHVWDEIEHARRRSLTLNIHERENPASAGLLVEQITSDR